MVSSLKFFDSNAINNGSTNHYAISDTLHQNRTGAFSDVDAVSSQISKRGSAEYYPGKRRGHVIDFHRAASSAVSGFSHLGRAGYDALASLNHVLSNPRFDSIKGFSRESLLLLLQEARNKIENSLSWLPGFATRLTQALNINTDDSELSGLGTSAVERCATTKRLQPEFA